MAQQSGYPDLPILDIAAAGTVAPGLFVCAPLVYAPGSPTSLTVNSTTLAAWSTGVACTNVFTAPGSGKVVVEATFAAEVGTGGSKIVYGLAAAGTVSPVLGNVITAVLSSGTTLYTQAVRFYVTGLTAAVSYQFDLLGAVSASTATIIAAGSTSTTVGSAGAPVIVTVQAA